jgi:hypothetical protein
MDLPFKNFETLKPVCLQKTAAYWQIVDDLKKQ